MQSKSDLLSLDFFAPKPQPGIWFFPRPFTVPLFFKLAGSDPYKMVMLQKLTYCIAVTFFLQMLFLHLKSNFIKIVAQFSLLFFFTWWNIAGWTSLPVSESLSLSFMLFWFGGLLFVYKQPSWISLVLLIGITFLLSFTRDTWPYVILLYACIHLLFCSSLQIGNLKKSITYIIFALCLFFFQNFTANRGERHRLPVFNSLAGRIAQNDQYLSWFKDRGMPQGSQLKKDFKNTHADIEGRPLIYKRYSDSTYSRLFTWIIKDGKATYQKFLLTHPAYLFLSDIPNEEINKNIWAYNLEWYCPDASGFFVNTGHVFPLFNRWFYLLTASLLILFFQRTKNNISLFLLIVLFLFFMNALLSYNADSLEIKRHLFITRIVFEWVSLTSLFLYADYYYLFLLKKKENRFN